MRVAESQLGDANSLGRQRAALRKAGWRASYRCHVWELLGRPDPVILPPKIALHAGSPEVVDAPSFLRGAVIAYFDEEGAAYELSQTQGRPADVDTATALLARQHLGLCLDFRCSEPAAAAASIDYIYQGDMRAMRRAIDWCAKHRPTQRGERDKLHRTISRAARELLAARAGDLTPIR